MENTRKSVCTTNHVFKRFIEDESNKELLEVLDFLLEGIKNIKYEEVLLRTDEKKHFLYLTLRMKDNIILSLCKDVESLNTYNIVGINIFQLREILYSNVIKISELNQILESFNIS